MVTIGKLSPLVSSSLLRVNREQSNTKHISNTMHVRCVIAPTKSIYHHGLDTGQACVALRWHVSPTAGRLTKT